MVEAPRADRTDQALMSVIHRRARGSIWTNRENWSSSSPIDDWHGVLTLQPGRVFTLDLTRNRMRARIPSGVGGLGGLGYLRLGG